jgi:hypothetical protein
MMSNHAISHGKTMFDIFNMINPNCYQALIIQAIIENKKEEAIQFCDELATAFEYYKWDSAGKQSSYTDGLICDSNLEQWKKLALIRIISNNVKQCRDILEKEVENDRASYQSRCDHAKKYGNSSNRVIDDLCEMFGFNKLI